MAELEVFSIWCGPYELVAKIKEQMDLGWKVLYTIPVWQPPPPPLSNYVSSTSQYLNVSSDGSISLHIPASAPPTGPPQIEVCFYKRNWKDDPCPRCSYPFPNEDNIGRDT